MPSSPLCVDCGWDTAPVDEHGEPVSPSEYYTVHDDLWHAAGMSSAPGAGMLCIGCLEGRIGRQLHAADFTDAPVNDPHPAFDTARLLCRKRGAPAWSGSAGEVEPLIR